MIQRLSRLLFGTLRRQLIVGIAAVNVAMMVLFIWLNTQWQHSLIAERQTEQAKAIAQTLAASSAGWLSARDIAGLQEIILAQTSQPDLEYAMLLTPGGQVLAHTDASRLGMYLHDLPSLPVPSVLNVSHDLIDVAVPSLLEGRITGWARVGLSQANARAKQDELFRDSLLYAFAASLVGSLIAWGIGTRLTAKLYTIRRVSSAVRAGQREARVPDLGHDETGQLADDINAMLQSLEQAGNSVREHRARLSSYIEHTPYGILVTDETGRIVDDNPMARKLLGHDAIQLRGLDLSDCVTAGYAGQIRQMLASLPQSSTHEWELEMRRADGSAFPAAFKAVRLAPDRQMTFFSDISERKVAEEQIHQLAFFDPLTHLPNRRLLLDRLHHAIVGSQRNHTLGALLFIDLDNFKQINDTLGHEMGDRLLAEVAKRLTGSVREDDTVARLGGDEFVVLLENCGNSPDQTARFAETVADKIVERLGHPYQIGQHTQYSTPSIGIALLDPQQRSNADEVLKHADLAMYQAKAAGRNTVRFFDPAMQATLEARTALEDELRQALLCDQLFLRYQPQVNRQGQLIGVEALVRWERPGHGTVPPDQFIGIAEETRLILPLGRLVLKQACQRLAEWAKDPGTAHLNISVNVSAVQFHDPNYVKETIAEIRQSGIDPKRLKLELTESVLLHDVETTISKMEALRALGVSFSLDDFGTGYSSMSYLKRLPLSQLKIDTSFVRDLLTDPSDTSIVRAIIGMGNSLGLRIIAEGVENQAQWEILLAEGCHEGQGYLFGHPLSTEELMRDWFSPEGTRPQWRQSP